MEAKTLFVRPKLTPYQMFLDVGSLSSGTISRLANTQIYTEIDEYLFHWRHWILTHGNLPKWETWQDCYDEYTAYLNHLKEQV